MYIIIVIVSIIFSVYIVGTCFITALDFEYRYQCELSHDKKKANEEIISSSEEDILKDLSDKDIESLAKLLDTM